MILYLSTLAIMSVAATALSFTVIQAGLNEHKFNLYDARGFYMIVSLVVIFLLTSLAFYWGDSRFDVPVDANNPAILGLLFALCCSLVGLGFGFVRLKAPDSIE